MKKITVEQAYKLLEDGKPVKAKISSRDVVVVKTTEKLRTFAKLKEEKVQELELFEMKAKDLPENCIEISLDDAIDLLSKGENIYGRREDDEDLQLTSQNALIQYYRSAVLRGEPVMYWQV